jgi:mono/diheme cytochrome c family protein
VFCTDTPPKIGSLSELQQRLDLDPAAPPHAGTDYASVYGVTKVALALGHSTALSGHVVSPLNPRLLILGERTFMAFQRGVQQLELITVARDRGTFNFYLVEFVQACNQREEGCQPGDLYTPRLERDWLAVTVRDDEDLKNTPSDCRQCHQRARAEPTLLMRELNNPWTHFFEPELADAQNIEPRVKGRDLMRDYLQAKGDEPYGGLGLHRIIPIAPFLLESLVGPDQPVFFDAPGIENERWPYRDGAYAVAPQPSSTWEAAYEAFKRGEQLALPYIEQRVTDPDKQAALSKAYARYRAREISADELPNLADIFPDDPKILARIGLQTEPDASPVEALIQACGSCHNDVLDPTISRARFNIDLARLDAEEIARAVERIERPSSAPGTMPPPEARQLDAAGRARLLDYLRQPQAREPDWSLQHAAREGMAGGSKRANGTLR